MADQCIVCLENLDSLKSPLSPSAVGSPESKPAATADPPVPPVPPAEPGPPLDSHNNHDNVAVIHVCGHTLHDDCLREWTGKANSCPICRQSFHLVHVYDKVGGTLLSSYKVEDRKQVAEFDPQAWLDENLEEEESSTPCLVCSQADQEEVLLLCEGCDSPYHTHCIGLDEVPHDPWFCMECADLLGPDVHAPIPGRSSGRRRGLRRRNDFFPRTQASMRRARQRARSDNWQGAWGHIAGHVWDALNIDLDSHDADDALEEYRRSRQLREAERREHQRWQQRLNIARRLGAQDVFARNLPDAIIQQANAQSPLREQIRATPVETREERQAWGAFERARESDAASTASRKRKSRSVTGSPVEPPPEPERRLKRPRTRRIGTQSEASSSESPSLLPNRVERNGIILGPSAVSPRLNPDAPSFLSSLLREVETTATSDDENVRALFSDNRPAIDPSSPGSSPTASTHNSPRALSITPPPHRSLRPSSPTLLSSHIEPIYPPANYSPTRSAGESSDTEQRSPSGHSGSELRQPRPRRQQPVLLPRSPDVSPTRAPLSLEMKENISKIVRTALKPHWKSSQLTADQYAAINRDVSRKLYEGVTDPASVDADARRLWENIASKEVARAVAELKA